MVKHFVEARENALAALRDAELAALASRVALIFDLRGVLRVLARATPQADAAVLRARLEAVFPAAAGPFWGDAIWIDTEKNSPSEQALYAAVWNDALPEPPGQSFGFVLDRRFSQAAWFGSPFEPPWPLDEHAPPIVSFYSFKGGVGRATALASVAINAARAGRRVVVVDFDLESPGASALFAPVAGNRAELGLVDFLLEWERLPKGARRLDDYVHVCDHPDMIGSGPEILVAPVGKVDAWYLEKLARVNYAFPHQRGLADAATSPLHELLKMPRKRARADLVLIDSRAGFHDLGGLSLSGLAHWHVLLGLNSNQSWAGLENVVDHLGRRQLASGRVQRDCTVAHALAPPSGDARAAATAAFRERSYDVFAARCHDPPDAPAEWPVPDAQAVDEPHYPLTLSWDSRLFGYGRLEEVANYLCEGEHRDLAATLFERLDRPPP